jgi:hypothetical protein
MPAARRAAGKAGVEISRARRLECHSRGTPADPPLSLGRVFYCPGWHNSLVASVSKSIPQSIDDTQSLLASADYVAERSLSTAVFLSLKMRRPLFLEGEAGVGKTEIAKVLAATLGRRLVRLQCYEGLDIASAVYEWNYSRQMIEIRLAEAEGVKSREGIAQDIFSEKFLIRRPLLQALEGGVGGAPVLLIDELDRTDEPFGPICSRSCPTSRSRFPRSAR